MKPKLPLHVMFEDGDHWILYNDDEIASSLEWYDSNDEDDTTKVIDDLGRPVKLKIEALIIIYCELEK
ncbi:MAG TPA: hypothetical protein DCE78_00390 [Bacteroidetes bacterium]|nr:hypothetical protein [Bacteroidota bacterium]